MPVDSSHQGLLIQACQGLGVAVSEAQGQALFLFLNLVLEKNEVMNLTSITEPKEAVLKHLVDSLSPLGLEPIQAQIASGQTLDWADLGSGAGFPGLPLAILCPQIRLHLVESTGKKAHFLEISAAQMGLSKQVQVHNQRIELAGAWFPRGTKPTSLRGQMDAVFVRGLSKLAAVIELALPLLKVGGILVAYKGPKAEDELAAAKKAMTELRCDLLENKVFTLPETGDGRSLLIFKKLADSPKIYPRLNGLPQSAPLL